MWDDDFLPALLAPPDDDIEFNFSFTSPISSGPLTCTRASTASYYNPDGNLVMAPADTLRIQTDPVTGKRGALFQPLASDKCAAKSLTPENIASSGVLKTGDGAATLTLITDAPAIASVGLSILVPSGVLYRLDNTAGTGNAFANVTGDVGVMAAHTLSAWLRVVSNGSTNDRCIGYGGAGSQTASVPLDGPLARVEVVLTPNDILNNLFFVARAGQVVDFIAFGMTEETMPTSYVTGDGVQFTRAADDVTTPLPAGNYDVTATFIDGSTQLNSLSTVSGILTFPTYAEPVSSLALDFTGPL